MISYQPQKIEKKWQKEWEKKKLYRANDKSKKLKFYQLETFPYPSSAGLHVGHPKGYIAEDIHARYMRMKGYEVLYTMGWDAFGLPTENYAIQVGKSPKKVAQDNVKNFKRQVKIFGLSYDWDREINTSEPEYYKWTQWLFLELFKKGLAYKKKAKVNWCSKDQTVLANEQVIDGKCERDGEPVIQKEMEQWFFKITDYTERLLEDLKDLDWPEATVKRQEDWIGKSEGAQIEFEIKNSKFKIPVFTTRPDTLFGATYLVLAPEHKIIKDLEPKIENLNEVKKYIEKARHKTELQRKEETREKTGVELKGVKAINPANKEEISIWVADYVLVGYGTGAIMAVPAHDERDFEFAKKFNLPVRQVIAPHLVDRKNPPRDGKKNTPRTVVQGVVRHWEKDEVIQIVWKGLPWKTFVIGGAEEGEDIESAVRREIIEETGYTNIRSIKRLTPEIRSEWYADHKDENRYARMNIFLVELDGPEREEMTEEEKKKHDVHWVPRSAILSFAPVGEIDYIIAGLNEPEKAYTGEGIVINSGKFNEIPSEKAKWEITKFVGGKKQIQYKLRDWSVSRQRYWGVPIPIIYCDKCGVVPVPEKDLPVKLPNLKDYRPKGIPPLASSDKFLNVKCPKCSGQAKREPETLDTFVDSSWYYLRYTDPKNSKEFASSQKLKHWLPVDLYVIGAEHTTAHLFYARFITKFLNDQGYLIFKEPFLKLRHQGMILGPDGRRMSKRWGNVVNPDDVISQYGADTARIYEMFMGPFETGGPWDPKAIIGVYRFLNRVWNLIEKFKTPAFAKASAGKQNSKLEKIFNRAIKKVGEDIQNLKFNTAVSELMKLLNGIEDKKPAKEQIETFLKLLAPFAPHLAEELWSRFFVSKKSRIRDSQSESGQLSKNYKSIHLESWPKYDSELIQEETIDLVIQVNGKTRGIIKAPRDLTENQARELALALEKIKKHIAGKEIKRFIYIPNKLVNIVI